MYTFASRIRRHHQARLQVRSQGGHGNWKINFSGHILFRLQKKKYKK